MTGAHIDPRGGFISFSCPTVLKSDCVFDVRTPCRLYSGDFKKNIRNPRFATKPYAVLDLSRTNKIIPLNNCAAL